MAVQSRSNLALRRSELARLAIRWGEALLILGVLACIALALMNELTSFEVAMAMLIGGALQIGHAVAGYRRGWSRFGIVGSVLYLLAAIAVLLKPFSLNGWTEWLLIISLSCSGLSRVRVAVDLPSRAGRWEALSGLTSLAAAIIIGFGLPIFTLWPIAFIVALDLVIEGSSLANVGFAMTGDDRPNALFD